MFREHARWVGVMAVEVINPGTGGRRSAAAARPVVRQKPPRAVSERGPVLLPIAEVLSCQATGMVLLDGRGPAESANPRA